MRPSWSPQDFAELIQPHNHRPLSSQKEGLDSTPRFPIPKSPLAKLLLLPKHRLSWGWWEAGLSTPLLLPCRGRAHSLLPGTQGSAEKHRRLRAQATRRLFAAEAELEERLNLKLLRATYGDTWLDTGYPKSGLLGEK